MKWNTTSYALHGPDYPDDPALSFQPPKSVVALPWEAPLKAGPQTIRGFAWSPYGKVAKVEYSFDGGKAWHHLDKTGLPKCVRVDDIVIHPRERDLVIGTHGRGIWVMDIAPMEQLTEKVLAVFLADQAKAGQSIL